MLQTENSCSLEKDQIAALITMTWHNVVDVHLHLTNAALDNDKLAHSALPVTIQMCFTPLLEGSHQFKKNKNHTITILIAKILITLKLHIDWDHTT